MENIFVFIICISVFFIGTVTLAGNVFKSVGNMVNAWKDGQSQAINIQQTLIKTVSSNMTGSGSIVDIVLKNEGAVSFSDFEKWDVIIRYQSGTVCRLPYGVATPGWSVTEILQNGGREIYNPGIFDPTETMKISLRLSPSVTKSTINMATIGTSNGIKAEIAFGY
jgi:hypothetical protein